MYTSSNNLYIVRKRYVYIYIYIYIIFNVYIYIYICGRHFLIQCCSLFRRRLLRLGKRGKRLSDPVGRTYIYIYIYIPPNNANGFGLGIALL